MRRIKLLFGSALALVLALSLFAPTTVGAKEKGSRVTTTPETIETTDESVNVQALDQDAFDAKYPEGAKQGEIINIADYYDGDVNDLIVWDLSVDGLVFWYEGETEYHMENGEIWLYQPGTVTITFADAEDNNKQYTLEVTIVENKVDIVLDPKEVTIAPNQTTTISIETLPKDAWWFWMELAEQGNDSVTIDTTISDTSVIKVEKAYGEDDEWIGYTVTGLKEGTATISIKTDLGHVSVATVTVKNPVPTPPAKGSVAPKNGGPKTGDTTNTTMYMLMMLTTLISMSGYIVLKKQK